MKRYEQMGLNAIDVVDAVQYKCILEKSHKLEHCEIDHGMNCNSCLFNQRKKGKPDMKVCAKNMLDYLTAEVSVVPIWCTNEVDKEWGCD